MTTGNNDRYLRVKRWPDPIHAKFLADKRVGKPGIRRLRRIARYTVTLPPAPPIDVELIITNEKGRLIAVYPS